MTGLVSEPRGAHFPEWLPKPSCPVTIVCGPPCAGKSTHVAKAAGARDLIYDLDVIRVGLTGQPLHSPADSAELSLALRERNTRLARLEFVTHANAWIILALGHPAMRRWWAAKTGGRVLLVDPGREACLARAASRPDPAGTIAGIESWYEEATGRERWTPPAMHAEERGGAAYNNRWRKARITWLSREENAYCAMCRADGRGETIATVVDHIRPHRNDSALFWDRSNWQPLCDTHHSAAKQRFERTGRIAGVGLDGRPTDSAHPAWREPEIKSADWGAATREFLHEHAECELCGEDADSVGHLWPPHGDADLRWSRDNWRPLCTDCADAPPPPQDWSDAA